VDDGAVGQHRHGAALAPDRRLAEIEDPDPVIFLEPKRLYNGPFDGHHDRPVTPWARQGSSVRRSTISASIPVSAAAASATWTMVP
jgi:pyruvate/2-oxoglutarate/acetoin dehydrogenase E1 component